MSLSINPASHISYPSCKTSRKWMTQMYNVSHWMKTLGENNYVNSETSEIHANSYIMLKNPCIFPYYIWNPCKLPENLQSSCKLPNNVQNLWKRQISVNLQNPYKLPANYHIKSKIHENSKLSVDLQSLCKLPIYNSRDSKQKLLTAFHLITSNTVKS